MVAESLCHKNPKNSRCEPQVNKNKHGIRTKKIYTYEENLMI